MRLKLLIPTEDLAQILFGVGQQHASCPMSIHVPTPPQKGPFNGSWGTRQWQGEVTSETRLVCPHLGHPARTCGTMGTGHTAHLLDAFGLAGSCIREGTAHLGSLAGQKCLCLSISAALQHYHILGILAGIFACIHPPHS